MPCIKYDFKVYACIVPSVGGDLLLCVRGKIIEGEHRRWQLSGSCFVGRSLVRAGPRQETATVRWFPRGVEVVNGRQEPAGVGVGGGVVVRLGV